MVGKESERIGKMVSGYAPRLDLLLRPLGFPRGAGKALVEDAARQVAAIELLHLQVDEQENGLLVTCRLTPRGGTELARYIGWLAPDAHREPLPAASGAALRVDWTVPAKHLARICAPFVDSMVHLQTDAETRAAGRARTVRAIECMDGTASWVLDDKGMRMAFGMQNIADYAHLARSDDNHDQVRAQLRRQRIDYEVELAALQHRGTRAMRTQMTADTPTAGLSDPNGVTTGFAGPAGQLWLVAMGGPAPQDSMIELLGRRARR